MIRRPPRSTLIEHRLPYPTLCRFCEQHIDESVGDGFETSISRDDRRPAVDPRGAAADDALIAAIADADADRRSFGELDVGAAAQPARADRKSTRLNSSH